MTTKNVTDITTQIPANHVVGRLNSDGTAQTIHIDDLTQAVAQRGILPAKSAASLGNSGVTAGSYTSTNLTVNAQGLITAASNGSGGGGGSGLFSAVLSTLPTSTGTGLTTWLNQGTATVTDGLSGVALQNSQTGFSVAMRYKAAPATPYTIDALILQQSDGSSYPGIGWYDGTNKLQLFGINGNQFLVGNANTPTSYSSNAAATGGNYASNMFWLRIKDDGTNVTYYYGMDGDQFIQLYTVAKSSGWLGATGYANVGFFISAQGSPIVATLASWKVH